MSDNPKFVVKKLKSNIEPNTELVNKMNEWLQRNHQNEEICRYIQRKIDECNNPSKLSEKGLEYRGLWEIE